MDAYMSEIIAVLSDHAAGKVEDVVEQLKTAGLEVSRVDAEEGVVEGLVETGTVKAIEKMPGVDYVRTVFTYAANFPPGDPRDRDGI